MKHVIVAVVWLVLTAPSLCGAAQHEHVVLNGDWDFTYTGASTAAVPELPAALAYDAQIRVLGRWDEQLERFKHSLWWPHAVFQTSLGPVQYLSGIGWHRKRIDVPNDWAGRTTTLTIGGAVGTTHVWINGKYLAKNEIGVYTPFELDVSRELVAGQSNEIVIAVDNASPNPFGGWALMGNSGRASGLARPVTLDVAAGSGSIADLFIRPGDQLNDVVWNVEVKGRAASSQLAGSKIEWSVREAASNRELKRGVYVVSDPPSSSSIQWTSHIEDIKPWSDREPNLYVTELKWHSASGQLIDSHTQRFGLRRYSYKGRKLFLNDKPLYLRLEFGAYYFPLDGAVPMSKEFWLTHMRRTKELGFNGINFAAQVCPLEMMEAADEVGLILQCGDQETTRPENKDRYQEVWNAIAHATRSHPSIAIYGFGGELEYYEGVIEQFKAQRELIKQLNPESLVMPQQAIHGIDYGINSNDPGVELKPFPHNAERLARYTEACDLFGHYSGGAFSHKYFDTPWRVMEDRYRIYSKPLVAHEIFISASYLNPANAAKYTGRIPPYIYTRLEKDLKDADLADRWSTYFDHTSRLQHICRKYCVEKVRKCDELAGYELLGMADMHFITPEYAVGMLDEFLNLKPGETVEGVRRYNDDNVLLLDFDNGVSINRCYWAGDEFQANIMASIFGPAPIKHGTLSWRLTRDGETFLDESMNIDDIPNGHVSDLKAVHLKWPNVEKTTRVNLSVQLTGSGCDIKNDWDFWVFPRRDAPRVAASADERSLALLGKRYPDLAPFAATSSEKLRIVSKLKLADIQHLAQGGDVVLLGTAPFTPYTQWPSFYPAKGYRPFSNGGTIIARHPVFAGHPNEGWNDWLFYPLMEGANSVLFDGAIDMPFDPIMEIISSAGHVRKQALMFEDRVGKGRLFVTSLVFDLRNPSCVTLLDSLIDYVQSEAFRPPHEIDAEELQRAIAPPEVTSNKLPDAGFEKIGYWVTESGHFALDAKDVHGGRKSLKLVVEQEDLKRHGDFVSSVSTRQMQFGGKSPRQLKLSGWFKVEPANSKASVALRAAVRYDEARVRSVDFSISPQSAAGGWHYVEKVFDLDGKVNYANVYIELAGAPATAWVDDLYFGEPAGGPVATATNSAAQATGDSAVWGNGKITRHFDAPVWYRIDNGDWKHDSDATIDGEGVHAFSIKHSEHDSTPKEETLRIDLSAPVVTLKIDPLPEQEAGVFTAKANARYSFAAVDSLSGVKSIEVAVDGDRFAPYEHPISLAPGTHTLRCRATDHAGNQSNELTGEWVTGTKETSIKINVLPGA